MVLFCVIPRQDVNLSLQAARALFWTRVWTSPFQACAWYFTDVKAELICVTSSPEGFVQGRVDLISSGIHISLTRLLSNALDQVRCESGSMLIQKWGAP